MPGCLAFRRSLYSGWPLAPRIDLYGNGERALTALDPPEGIDPSLAAPRAHEFDLLVVVACRSRLFRPEPMEYRNAKREAAIENPHCSGDPHDPLAFGLPNDHC